ncbi:MAG TPA: CdaR family protein [Verrucomicrobiae bacterium]
MMHFLRNLFLHDLGLKLFALGLALLIWATVQFAIRKEIIGIGPSGPQAMRTFEDLPVMVLSGAADVRAFRVAPACVAVTVRGEREILRQLTEKEMRATVDLTDIAEARDLRKHVDVATPPGITLVRVAPPDVEVVVPPK